jgi:hypothetical protein
MQQIPNQRKTFLIIVLMAVGATFAFAIGDYLTSFQGTYPASQYPNVTPLYTCNVCHTSGYGLNRYAEDYIAARYSFAAAENQDSDNDTFSNIAEIRAGTFPGDASSHPPLADTTPPAVSAFSIPSTSTSLTVSITSFTATDNVGVTGYMATESAASPSAGAGGWSATAPTSFSFGTAGAKTLYGWAKDAAGNVSTCAHGTTQITLPSSDLNDMPLWEEQWFRVTILRKEEPNTLGYLRIKSWDGEAKILQSELYTKEDKKQNWESISLDLIYTSGSPLSFLFSFDYSGLLGVSGSIQGKLARNGLLQNAELKAAGTILADETEDEDGEETEADEDYEIVFDELVSMRGRLIPVYMVPPSLLSRENLNPDDEDKGRTERGRERFSVNSGRIEKLLKTLE